MGASKGMLPQLSANSYVDVTVYVYRPFATLLTGLSGDKLVGCSSNHSSSSVTQCVD